MVDAAGACCEGGVLDATGACCTATMDACGEAAAQWLWACSGCRGQGARCRPSKLLLALQECVAAMPLRWRWMGPAAPPCWTPEAFAALVCWTSAVSVRRRRPQAFWRGGQRLLHAAAALWGLGRCPPPRKRALTVLGLAGVPCPPAARPPSLPCRRVQRRRHLLPRGAQHHCGGAQRQPGAAGVAAAACGGRHAAHLSHQCQGVLHLGRPLRLWPAGPLRVGLGGWVGDAGLSCTSMGCRMLAACIAVKAALPLPPGACSLAVLPTPSMSVAGVRAALTAAISPPAAGSISPAGSRKLLANSTATTFSECLACKVVVVVVLLAG